MKCRRCRGPAAVEVRRHNAAFCAECFVHHVHEQVKRAIKAHDMFGPDDRILVCVSGGKDSLGLWDALLEMGYRVSGMHLGLGIGEYSRRSVAVARAFAHDHGTELIEVDLRGEYGFDIPTAGRSGSRSTCAVCGLSSGRRSTGSPWTTGSMSLPPATISTMRRRPCWGTPCGGRRSTSRASG